MKHLFPSCCIAVGLLLPVTMNTTLRAEPPYEHHAEIHAALHSLETARFRLKHAAHDFGGHREAAIRACDAAIEQLKIALAYDRD